VSRSNGKGARGDKACRRGGDPRTLRATGSTVRAGRNPPWYLSRRSARRAGGGPAPTSSWCRQHCARAVG
jgi:hypothetical protein